MHRDISDRNIYCYEGRGLLGDFEYMKKMGTKVAHEVRRVSRQSLISVKLSLIDCRARPVSFRLRRSNANTTSEVAVRSLGLGPFSSITYCTIWSLLCGPLCQTLRMQSRREHLLKTRGRKSSADIFLALPTELEIDICFFPVPRFTAYTSYCWVKNIGSCLLSYWV